MDLTGYIVDIIGKEIFPGMVCLENGRIAKITRKDERDIDKQFIMPGFVDAHVHIESSMLVPSEFARIASTHGTVATVSDPHEIANVLGVDGVKYMLEDASKVPFKFFFGAPSCVPATGFETAGASLGVEEVTVLLDDERICYLSEMMNWPGVLHSDPEVLAKIEAARLRGKVVDGHAPGLAGDQAKRYIEAGISSDHECVSLEEARGKLGFGMKLIMMREGSAAKNLDALIDLLDSHPENVAFCTDDSHPDELLLGHINALVRRSVAAGKNLMAVLRAACLNPVEHYDLNVGLLRERDPADFIVVSDLEGFSVLETYIGGTKVAEHGESLIDYFESPVVNQFDCHALSVEDVKLPAKGRQIRAIKVLDGQLITEDEIVQAHIVNGEACASIDKNLLKIVVYNRYRQSKPALGFVRNFGLKRGALSSTVAHDCHNIIAVGANDEDLVTAINTLVETKGGIAAIHGSDKQLLELPVAGLMSNRPGKDVGRSYAEISSYAKQHLGCTLSAPFMTMSFLALLVIPKLKLSDKVGLFDGERFEAVSLFVDA